MAPSNVAGGETRAIAIHDFGGTLSRVSAVTIGALIGAAFGVRYDREETVHKTEYVDATITETHTVTTIGVDQAGVEHGLGVAGGLFGGAVEGDVPIETTLAVSTTALGGDTSGFRWETSFRVGGPSRRMRASVGFLFAHFGFDNRATTTITTDMASSMITATVAKTSPDFWEVGLPARLEVWPVSLVSVYGQADLNVVTLENEIARWLANDGSDVTPSPWRFGARLWLGPVIVDGEVVGNALDFGRRSFLAEASLVF